jgi:hypothetical protein
MTQLSRPYQIALVTLALLVLVWFATLHRGTTSSGGGSGASAATPSAPTPPSGSAEARAAAAPSHIYHGAAPGVEGLTRAINKAHGAVALSQHEAQRVETSEPSASTSSASTSTATPATHTTTTTTVRVHTTSAHVHASSAAVKHAVSASSIQVTVERELQRGKTVLILFWDRHGSDDIAVQHALGAVRHALGGRVAIHYATAGQVGQLGTITHAVQITQTPTLLIVNPHGQTTVLTGLADAFAIQQAVSESRHP